MGLELDGKIVGEGIVGELIICWEGRYPIFGPILMLMGGGLLPFVLFVLIFLFFLKSRSGYSCPSIFPISLLEFNNWVWPSSEFLASLRLLIFGVILSFYISPWALILIWKSSIQLMRRIGSLVSILVIKFLRKGEIGPGNWSSLLFSTSIKFAIELLWKGHIPKIISYSTTPTDQISALFE